MKKYVLLSLCLLGTSIARAEGQFGIQVSPSMSINRVYTNPNNAGFSSAGKAFRFKLGAIYDYPFQDRYYISTGLLYATQHLAIKNEDLSPAVREKHALSYLQVPLLLRLCTSELTLDTRLYVTLGAFGQVRVDARNTDLPKGQQQSFIESFRRWGWGVLLGVGVEHHMSLSTSVFAGISWHRSLLSAIEQQRQWGGVSLPPVMGYGDMLSVDIGIRF